MSEQPSAPLEEDQELPLEGGEEQEAVQASTAPVDDQGGESAADADAAGGDANG